jgi:hypothetical protein
VQQTNNGFKKAKNPSFSEELRGKLKEQDLQEIKTQHE